MSVSGGERECERTMQNSLGVHKRIITITLAAATTTTTAVITPSVSEWKTIVGNFCA